MTNLELAKEQGNQAAPNIIDAAKASEVQIDITLAQEQGNQATPLIADSFAGSESYDAIKQQGTQAMPLIVDALEQPAPPTIDYLYFEAVEANSTVALLSMLETAPNLEHSTDGVTWQEWPHTTNKGIHIFDTLVLGAVGDKVYLRGDNPKGFGTDSLIYSYFALTGAVNSGGKIMSLLNADMELTEVPEFGFFRLFAIGASNEALIIPPEMDTITAIGENGCGFMFLGHSTLTSAADMPQLTTIGNDGCYGMYENCTFNMSDDGTTLNFDFPAPPITTTGETPETYATAYDVANWMGNTNGFAPPEPTDGPMYFEAVEANSTVAMMSILETAPNLEYSTDGVTWQEWPHTTADGTHTFDTITLGAVGDRVYLRGVNSAGFLDVENQIFSLFSMTGKIAAGGNAQSLTDGDTPTLAAKTMPIFSDFAITHHSSDVLTQAPTLPATTLVPGCYLSIFSGCTGLTQAPTLPATTLAEACYLDMFGGCTGLTQAPALPATTLADYCYENMFYDCTGLTQAPSLPATTLAESCYAFMFGGCEFDMSDDGTTFNFQCGATLPQTVGEDTFTTPAELAAWMGNTNGFTEP